LASNVEYYANNQSIAARTYGNLLLTGASGTVVKTMPATAITVQGNFSSTAGTATTVSYTAAAALTFNGNVSIGAATTFDGSSFSHTVAGNLSNAGTLTGNTSTINLTGANMSVSGSGTYNFSNLVIAGSGINASSTNITIGGNLSYFGLRQFYTCQRWHSNHEWQRKNDFRHGFESPPSEHIG
jgi:fibronectin-binding autotransporter adhesin